MDIYLQIADEIKTSIEKIIAKHKDCFCSPWEELQEELFATVDYHLTADTRDQPLTAEILNEKIEKIIEKM